MSSSCGLRLLAESHHELEVTHELLDIGVSVSSGGQVGFDPAQVGGGTRGHKQGLLFAHNTDLEADVFTLDAKFVHCNVE